MGAQRADPDLKADQPVSAELLSVWVGGHGAAELQLRLIFFFFFLARTDVFKVLLGRAKPHVVGNHLDYSSHNIQKLEIECFRCSSSSSCL